jgi:hypothetical protein
MKRIVYQKYFLGSLAINELTFNDISQLLDVLIFDWLHAKDRK